MEKIILQTGYTELTNFLNDSENTSHLLANKEYVMLASKHWSVLHILHKYRNELLILLGDTKLLEISAQHHNILSKVPDNLELLTEIVFNNVTIQDPFQLNGFKYTGQTGKSLNTLLERRAQTSKMYCYNITKHIVRVSESTNRFVFYLDNGKTISLTHRGYILSYGGRSTTFGDLISNAYHCTKKLDTNKVVLKIAKALNYDYNFKKNMLKVLYSMAGFIDNGYFNAQ
jgi:hypothetical protein